MVIEGSFPFLKEKGHVISLVGAGGKTTLMYAFAEVFAAEGFRTLVTTTTHIFKPDGGVFAVNEKEIEALWDRGLYAATGAPAEDGKLKRLPEKEWNAYVQMADTVLVESDGAKRMPCKVPAGHEPVIPDECDIVVGVMGMDAIGRPLKEVCFRPEQAVRLLNVSQDEILTPLMAAEILSSEDGTARNVKGREYYVVLNKCDRPEQIRAGREIRRLLADREIETCVLTGALQKGI